MAKAANFVAWAGFLMILGFVIFCGHLLTDTHLTELATGLGRVKEVRVTVIVPSRDYFTSQANR